MATEIKIFEHNDKPFGCLSNNYSNDVKGSKHPVSVIQNLSFSSGRPCKTLTNYIYASLPLLHDYQRKQKVCAANPKYAKLEFDKEDDEEKKIKVKQAIQEALKAMFNNNIALTELLLSTGTGKIVYLSDNKFLGNCDGDKGLNLYGVCLEQERNRLVGESMKQQKEQDKAAKDNIMYDTYLAYKGLTSAIQGGNDLKEWIGRSPADLLKNVFNREELEKSLLSKENFLSSFATGTHFHYIKPCIENPENIVRMIRKYELRKLWEKRNREMKKKIFNMYADYLLAKKEVPEDQHQEAKEQQFSGESFLSQANDLEDRLYALYKKGSLSETLSTKIDDSVRKYDQLTLKEVEEAENYDLSFKKVIPRDQHVPVSSNNQLIYIIDPGKTYEKKLEPYNKYIALSPVTFRNPILTINSFAYPTVSHYIIEQLIFRLGVSNARSYILKPIGKSKTVSLDSFLDLSTLISHYNRLKNEYYKKNLLKYAKIGLDKKFANRVLQDYLLATGDAKLIYNDPNDFILGSGDNSNGDNYVGKYLMELRSKFVNERKTEEFKDLTTSDITSILEKNNFMKDWVKQRVEDSCRTLVTMHRYVQDKNKNKKEVVMTKKFAEFVLDNIYNPCSPIYGAIHEIKAPIPEYFLDMVRMCNCMETSTGEIADVLWKRIAVIIYYLIIHLKDKGLKIDKISSQIGRVQVLKSEEIKCEKIVSDEYENCIIVALVNLIIGIINFNRQNSNSKTKVTNLEVQTAASIIIESIIPNKSRKPKDDGIEVAEEVLEDPKEQDGTEVAEEVPGNPEDEFDIEELIDDAIKKNQEKQEKQENGGFVFDVSDSDSEKDPDPDSGEEDPGYNSGEGSEPSSQQSEYAPTTDKIQSIVEYLEGFTDIETDNTQELATYINKAVEIIKNKSILISNQIKRNRVNFFSVRK